MANGCPVCGTTRENDVSHCSQCGFPFELKPALAGQPPRPAPREETPPEAPVGTPVRSHSEAPPPSPTNAPASEVLRLVALLGQVGAEDDAPASALATAASQEALGDAGAAEKTLVAERLRIEGAVVGAAIHHRDRLRARRQALVERGIDLPKEPELETLTDDRVKANTMAALTTLAALEGRIGHIEGVWQGLEQQFEEIATVRSSAVRFGWSIVGIPSRVEGLRASLRTGRVPASAIEQASLEARAELRELGEALKDRMKAEFERLGAEQTDLPEDPVAVHRVSVLLARGERHLEEGRPADAMRDLLDLAGQLPGAGPAQGGAGGEAPVTSGPGGGPPVTAESIRAMVRSLAERLRTLPGDSPVGRTAAAEIREATELLRQGRLTDADSILTRLKRSFDSTLAPHEGT